MTLNEIIHNLSNYHKLILVYLFTLPALTLLYGLIHKKENGNKTPHQFVYASIIYLTTIPGTFSTTLTLYSFLFLKTNLLELNFIIYFLPILSMIITISLISKKCSIDDIPGFNRLFGLLISMSLAFFGAFLFLKMRLWLVFGGGILMLIVIALILFAIFEWGIRQAFKSKKKS